MKLVWKLIWTLYLTEIYGEIVYITLEEQTKKLSEANKTCQQQINQEVPFNESYCEREWDTLACWPPTPAGSIASIPCPNYLNGFDTGKNAHKICTNNGTWFFHPALNLSWTDYTQCPYKGNINAIPELIKKHMPYIRMIFNIGYGISLVSLILATSLMLSFRRLRCPRNIIHINLFISFILRASISFMKENLLVNSIGFPSDVLEVDGKIEFKNDGTHWQCKMFFTAFHYILATNYMWILVEGLYLNILISVAVFSENSSIKWFILFGWASPILFVGPWVIVRATHEDTLCWNTHTKTGYFWIMKGPIVLSVAINFIIFLNTIRVLFTKLTAFNSFETKKFRYRRLAKSTLVLIPLFGVHYIVFIGLPDNVNEKAELVKLYFEMFLNSIQGFIVALLFCFLNSELQAEVAKKWSKYRLSHGRGHLNSHRDTITSFMSRGRGSVISASYLDGDYRRSSTIEMKQLKHQNNNHNGHHKMNDNGHVIQEETLPMIDMSEINVDQTILRPND